MKELAKGKPMVFNPSSIHRFLFCPYEYWLAGIRPKIKTSKSPEATLGNALHDIIHRFLYQILKDKVRAKNIRKKRAQNDEPTNYYYKTLGSFMGFCASFLLQSLEGEKATAEIIRDKRPIRWPKEASTKQIRELKEHFFLLGLWMAKNYYLVNQDKPVPFLIEKTLRCSLVNEIGPGIELSGRLDQARRNKNGKVFIPDIKTGFDPFERKFKNLEKDAEVPLVKLDADPQLAAYWYLYEKSYGQKPYKVGLYYLKTGRSYFTDISEDQIKNLFDIIRWIIQTAQAGVFPPTGMNFDRCRWCDYQQYCKHFQSVKKVQPISIEEIETSLPKKDNLIDKLEQELKQIDYQKIRLKLKKR